MRQKHACRTDKEDLENMKNAPRLVGSLGSSAPRRGSVCFAHLNVGNTAARPVLGDRSSIKTIIATFSDHGGRRDLVASCKSGLIHQNRICTTPHLADGS